MRSLAFKLTLAFFAVSLSGIALVALLASRVTANEFGAFAERQSRDLLLGQLQSYYSLNDTWVGVEQAVRASADPDRSHSPAVANLGGTVVLGGSGLIAGDVLEPSLLVRAAPVVVGGQAVGYLVPFPAGVFRPPPGGEFLARIRRNLGYAAAGAAALSLILGVLLSRTLTRPIRQLTEATGRIARGELDQHVSAAGGDELGKLASAFNRMSDELSRSLMLRRQMTADIAHELRTPIGVILGHAEALSDGVIPPTPDTFEVIHEEARRLARQVEDLRTLTLSDAGELSMRRVPLEPGAAVESAGKTHAAEAARRGIELRVAAAPGLPPVKVDPDRLSQVLDNLISNALRHTPAGGRVALLAEARPGGVRLAVRDSGAGVAPDDLPFIFDRYYRADPSRERSSGGSGLGLAIARSLVEAQGGAIGAEATPGGGLTVWIEFPSSSR